MQRILAEGKLKPHKTEYWCGRSPDPEFEAKQAVILGLYLSPPENALVLAVDEKSRMQALDRTQAELPMKAGTPRRLTATYKRHGTTCLLAALSVHDGEVTARCRDRNDQTTFLPREVMRGGVWSSKPQLIAQTMDDIKCCNETATPFAWTYTGKPLTV